MTNGKLRKKLLDRYKKKAGESAREADAKGDFKKGDKRFKGIVKATNKQFDNDLKKESVEIDETDKSYVKNLPTWKLEDLKKAREGMKNADNYKKAEADELEKRKKVKEEVESINEEIDNHINRLTKVLTDRSKASSHEGLHTEFSAQHGQKYTKIVGTTNGGKGQKSVHAFVHKETGDVYKPAGWNAPAKGARYNLHKHIDHLEKHADQYGSYLYKHK
jgi:DNA polymerase II small subunit/DNA polymerase delta subunit B